LGIRIANKREQLDLEQWVLFGADTHEYAGRPRFNYQGFGKCGDDHRRRFYFYAFANFDTHFHYN
jgi:hypothetical protein